MSGRSWNQDDRSLRGLYRDRENGWLFGVCAGVAEFFGFRTGSVRVIAVICLLLFFWLTILIYGAAALLLKERPLIYMGGSEEYEFWKRRAYRGRWTHS